MRIAIAGNLNKPVIKNSLGGTEAFTYQLIAGLAKRGHEVSLFATSDSITAASLIPSETSTNIRGVMESGIEVRFLYYLLQSRNITQLSDRFDIIHNNYYDSFFLTPFSHWLKAPLVSTIHNDFWYYKNMRSFYKETHRKEIDGFVFVSQAARELADKPLNSYSIYNGINSSEYEFAPDTMHDYILFLSRIVWQKGAREAVEAALDAQKTLLLTGPVPKNEEGEEYFGTSIKPFLSRLIHFIEPPSFERKVEFYQKAKAFLFPIQWEEPFGLVMAEAMACGTPVIAFARGAVPEVVKDGITGFIVNPSETDKRGNWIVQSSGKKGLIEAINKLFSLPREEYLTMRKACREHVEKNFTIEKLVDQYEALYTRMAQIYKTGGQEWSRND